MQCPLMFVFAFFFFSSRRRHTRWPRDWSSDVCSSDLAEAARAIGLGFVPSARLIIIPQAFRGAIAPVGNTLIALIKNTTVAAAASVQEVSILMGDMIEKHSNYAFPIFLTIAAGFVVIVIPVGLLTTLLSQRLAVSR